MSINVELRFQPKAQIPLLEQCDKLQNSYTFELYAKVPLKTGALCFLSISSAFKVVAECLWGNLRHKDITLPVVSLNVIAERRERDAGLPCTYHDLYSYLWSICGAYLMTVPMHGQIYYEHHKLQVAPPPDIWCHFFGFWKLDRFLKSYWKPKGYVTVVFFNSNVCSHFLHLKA